MDLDKSDHALLQLCQTLKSKEVDIICLIETNVHWSPFLIDRFKQILQSTWNKSKISFYTLESKVQWNSTYKPRGTAIIALKSISSAILNKGQDSSGMGRWTFMSILGKHNKITTIFNMYRSCNTNLHNAGESTVVRQQWLIMQKIYRQEHPHDEAITYIIKDINKKREAGNEIILTMDGNEPLVNDKGGISRIYRECNLYNPLDHRHGDIGNTKLYIRGSNEIDLILCTYNLLKMMIACGITAFYEVTTTDHYG